MKNTAFTKFHIDAGAKMVPFAGYNMPVEYTGITEEHITVREKIGVFDVSHMLLVAENELCHLVDGDDIDNFTGNLVYDDAVFE